MTDLSLKLVLQALDRGATPTVRGFTAVVRGLSREAKAAPSGWLQMQRSIDKTTGAATKFNEAGRRGGKVLDELIERQRRLRRESAQTDTVLGRLARTIGFKGGGGLAGFAASGALGGWVGLAGTTAAAGGALAVGGAAAGGRSVISTGARFEGYQAALKTANDGDIAKARADMAWVQKFAKTTPYDLDQVTESFIRLKAYGIDPTNGTLRSLGDGASAMQKDVMAAVEMLADAQTGEFERLKEFGVRARVQGEKVTFTYTKAGKDITVTSRKSASDIRRALLSIFDVRFKGAMDEQSKTWNGMMSNLGDSWVGFQKRIADKGLFDKARGHLFGLLQFIEKAEKDGRLDRWATKIADSLGSFLDSATRLAKAIDWVQLAQDIATVAKALADVAEAMARLNKSPPPKNPIEAWWKTTPVGWGPRIAQNAFAEVQARQKAKHPSGVAPRTWLGDQMDTIRNPWVRRDLPQPAPRSTGPKPAMPGLGGGPLPRPAPLKGDIKIGLAPGFTLQRSDFGPGVTTNNRRGPAG